MFPYSISFLYLVIKKKKVVHLIKIKSNTDLLAAIINTVCGETPEIKLNLQETSDRT